MRKVYIAGKITGDPEYREKFKYAEAKLQADGCIVLNPAVLPDGMEPKDYMRICFAMMEVADEVYFLPDWKDSAGAKLEWEWCSYVHKLVSVPFDPKKKTTLWKWVKETCRAVPEKLTIWKWITVVWNEVVDTVMDLPDILAENLDELAKTWGDRETVLRDVDDMCEKMGRW